MSSYRNVINPGAGPIDIPDVDDFLAAADPDDPPYVDLGGGMVVPLAELVEPGCCAFHDGNCEPPDDCCCSRCPESLPLEGIDSHA